MSSFRSALVLFYALAASAAADVFRLYAYNPGGTLHRQVIHARGQAFYTGIAGPATYCPTQVDPNCPDGTDTRFAGIGALWVMVPGGQQIYIAPDGALSFTQAHSAYIPPGSYIGGWQEVAVTSKCSSPFKLFGSQAPKNNTAGVFACPGRPPSASEPARYQIHAKIIGFNRTDCEELGGLYPEYLPADADFGAWQYT